MPIAFRSDGKLGRTGSLRSSRGIVFEERVVDW